MSVDLKGNTNFVVLKNLQDELIVPRTNLAAVDMVVANGLAVAGSTLSITMATTEDIELGTSGSIVTPDALKPVLDSKQLTLEAGTGVELVEGATSCVVSVPLAEAKELITGSTSTEIIDVDAFRGALTAGQAVDVTSVPDGISEDVYKESFTTSASTLGFASFPKFASGLKYLMIADVTVAAARNITPSGTWLNGTTAAKALAANTATRVAMLFNAANKGKFTFSGSGTVTVTNLREYEVTSCTPEAIEYIAALSNPDAFADYYLVKADMVQPFTYIIDMGTSPSVTVAAGLSYKLNASTGTHTLTVDTCPEGYDGRDAIIRIRLGGAGIVQAVAPLQLGGALVPYAINNCVVRFRDGEAVLLVEDTLAGYVVTVTSGTDSGSLAYGLAATGIPYIAFSTSTDGQVVDMGNAVTANEEVTVVGNGYTNTTITGNITCTNKTTVANLSLQDVGITGGTLTLGDAYIPSGSTVAVSGGGLAVEKVTGAGSESVIDFNGGGLDIKNPFVISGVTLTDADAGMTAAGCNNAFAASSGGVFADCTISSNHTGMGVIRVATSDRVLISNCLISDNLVTRQSPGGAVLINTVAVATIDNCTITGNYQNTPTGSHVDVCAYGTAKLKGSNTIGVLYGNGSCVLSSGAVLDLTGNTNATPIAPGGGIQVQSDVQVIPTGGTSYATYLDPREYATITKEANTTPAQYVYGYAQGITQGTSNYVPIVLENNVISRVSALDKTKMSCHERRICVMDDLATRHINYYLNPEDLTKKMDGTPSNLDGTDGDVMTEFMPAYYLELTLAPQNDTENRNCVLMSRYPFSYTDGNNVEHVAAYHDSFKISPTGDVVRPQYVGYYQATTQTVNGTNKLRSISSTSNKYVYPTVSLRLGPGSASTPTQDSFLVRAENNGGTICNELHYEWLFHLFVCDKLTVDTQSASIGFCYADSFSWGTIYPRACGYTNQVSNFYGGQTLADDRDVDMVPLWNNCTITANGLSWRTNAAACVWAADATTGKRVVSTYAWKNGNDLVYTKASDGLPAAGTKCYSDNACTVEAYTITASASPTAAANKVTSCKYFIENPWSSIWQNLAGFAPFVTGSTLGYFGTTSINRYKEILLTTTSQAGSDISASGGNVAIKWTNHTWPQANNYVTTWNMTTFLPITATSTNVMRNYFYTNATNANPRAGFRGGTAYNTSFGGLGYVTVDYVVGFAPASFGARLAA